MSVPADPTVVHPMPGQSRVVLLRPLVKSPLIEVGEYSYYDDPDDPTAFETRNVLYHYGPEKLVIGKFCALGTGVRFLMNGANHRMDGPSTFPFPTMGGSWAQHADLLTGLPQRGDTVVGNDVWFGYHTTVMPGVRIGHGAIIGAGAVVTADVPDYGIVGGNPARLIRRRYSDNDVARLLAVSWWDWPAEHITAHVRTIMSGSLADLEDAAPATPALSGIAIRPARPGEAGCLTDLALRSKAHWGYDAEFLASCREELTLGDAELAARRAAVAERDGGIVGFTTLEGDPPQGALGMMFVDPTAIGRGIGRLLFDHTVEVARRLGFTQFTIDADPNAEPFYEAMGARPVGVVPSGSIPGRTLTRFLRDI